MFGIVGRLFVIIKQQLLLDANLFSAGGEHLTILRRLAARAAKTTKRDHFTVQQVCTAPQVALFKEHKAVFEGLIKDSCTVKDGNLVVFAESVTLSVRKKPSVDLYTVTANIHVRRDLNI